MATGIVENMVCARCGRMNGRPHAENCPSAYEGPSPGVYEAGYLGAGHQKREVVELMQIRLAHVLDVFERAEQDLPRELRTALGAEGLLAPPS